MFCLIDKNMSTWTKVICYRLDITVSLDANVTQVWKNKRWFEESNFQVYWIRYLQVHPSDQSLILCIAIYVTKPAPIKGAASIQKLFFLSSTMVWFCQISYSVQYVWFYKIQKNASIFGKFLGAATIQEHPLLARVR